MNKRSLTIIFFLLWSSYNILDYREKVWNLYSARQDVVGFCEEQRQQQKTPNFITDIILIEDSTDCPQYYKQMLPFPTCGQQLNDRCYKSKQDIEYLTTQMNDEDKKNNSILTHKFKICSKTIDDPSDFRQILKEQMDYFIEYIFQKMCVYSDTPKRGYVSNHNECSQNSQEQQCHQDQIKFESQFLIACLNNKKEEYHLNRQFTCTQDEIVCSSDEMTYCVKNSEKCPIVDIEINETKMNLKGYDRVKVHDLDVYLYLKRNDLFSRRLIGFDIKETDTVQQENIIYSIEIDYLDASYYNNITPFKKSKSVVGIKQIQNDILDGFQRAVSITTFLLCGIFTIFIISQVAFYFFWINSILLKTKSKGLKEGTVVILRLTLVTITLFCIVAVFLFNIESMFINTHLLKMDYNVFFFHLRDGHFILVLIAVYLAYSLNLYDADDRSESHYH